MTTTDTRTTADAPADETMAFDKAVARAEKLLKKNPSSPVADTMLNYVLPLMRDLRDEVWSQLGDTTQRVEALEAQLADGPPGVKAVLDDALTIINLLGVLVDTSFLRAGWRTNEGTFAPIVPADLRDAFVDLQGRIGAWVGAYNEIAPILAEAEAAEDGEDGEDDGEDDGEEAAPAPATTEAANGNA